MTLKRLTFEHSSNALEKCSWNDLKKTNVYLDSWCVVKWCPIAGCVRISSISYPFPKISKKSYFLPQHLRDYFSPCAPFLVQNKSIRKHTGDFYSTEPFIQTYKYFSPPFRSDSLPGSNRHGKYCKPTFHPPPSCSSILVFIPKISKSGCYTIHQTFQHACTSSSSGTWKSCFTPGLKLAPNQSKIKLSYVCQ